MVRIDDEVDVIGAKGDVVHAAFTSRNCVVAVNSAIHVHEHMIKMISSIENDTMMVVHWNTSFYVYVVVELLVGRVFVLSDERHLRWRPVLVPCTGTMSIYQYR